MAAAVTRMNKLSAEGALSDPLLYTAKVVEQVQCLLDQATQTGAFVAAWDSIQDALTDARLGWKSQADAAFVGIHQHNRSRFGVSGYDVHSHGYDVLQVGFSWRRASDATGVEADPQDIEAKEYNDGLVNLAGGLIPPLQQLKLLSIGSSHTNAFLRAMKTRCKTMIEPLQDARGHIDTDTWCLRQPLLKQALSDGLVWFVIHRHAPKVWPTLIPVVQKALNTDARGGQTEVEVMLSMHVLMELSINEGKSPDWEHITKAAAFSMPACANYIPVLANFVQNHSGNGEMLEEISTFQKTVRDNGKKFLGSVFYAKLNSMTFGKGIKCPHVQAALIKANLSSPKNKITDNLCHMITSGHVTSMTSKDKLANTRNIDTLIAEARKLVSHVPKSEATVKALGMFDIRLVLHVLKIGKQLEDTKFESLGEIVQVQLLKQQSKPPCPITSVLEGVGMAVPNRHVSHFPTVFWKW